jgi:mono/diheme cytochrome c family protein
MEIMKVNNSFLIIAVAVWFVACAKKVTPTATAKKTTAPEVGPQASVKYDSTSLAEKKAAAKRAQELANAKPIGETLDMSNSVEAKMGNGKQVYYVKCSKCHEAKSPDLYTADRWVKIVDWMGPRAKITEIEKENILAYVKAFAKK